MYIIGINFKPFGGHDASAALLKDGKIIAAAEEERFIRKKHSGCAAPMNAISFCMDFAGITLDDVDYIAQNWSKELCSRRSFLPETAEGFMETLKIRGLRKAVSSTYNDMGSYSSLRKWRRLIRNGPEVRYIPHHLTHMASAYYPSGFWDAKVINIEGIAEITATSFGEGKHGKLYERGYIPAPHSLGFFYSGFTQFLGFQSLNGEGKVMGLAPYGRNRYDLSEIIKIIPEGFEYDIDYGFGCQMGKKTISRFGHPRKRDDKLTRKHKDIAASVQHTLERTALHLLELLDRKVDSPNLALAGGVALNVKMNKLLLEHSSVENIFIQPAANDAGCAIGAALELYAKLGNTGKWRMDHTYLGPSYSNEEIAAVLSTKEIKKRMKDSNVTIHEESDISSAGAHLISEGKIIGWFQGRMEFGPRALGNRSILADPRNPHMKDILNRRVKFRESFRPYCPSILEKKEREYFEKPYPSPFMVLSFDVKKDVKEDIPSVIHIDGTSRPQTVNRGINPMYWRLINKFRELSDVPLILNTSFNIRGEPIVNTPREAISCFIKTGMDCLALGKFLLIKNQE